MNTLPELNADMFTDFACINDLFMDGKTNDCEIASQVVHGRAPSRPPGSCPAAGTEIRRRCNADDLLANLDMPPGQRAAASLDPSAVAMAEATIAADPVGARIYSHPRYTEMVRSYIESKKASTSRARACSVTEDLTSRVVGPGR